MSEEALAVAADIVKQSRADVCPSCKSPMVCEVREQIEFRRCSWVTCGYECRDVQPVGTSAWREREWTV